MKLKTFALLLIGSSALVLSSAAQSSQTVFAGSPPPAPVETVVPAPGPGYVWVNGQWIWNGGWVWSPGYWTAGVYPNGVWIGGRWDVGPHGYRGVVRHVR